MTDSCLLDGGGSEKERALGFMTVAKQILHHFPEMATHKHRETGMTLLHHTAHKAAPEIAPNLIQLQVNMFPGTVKSSDSQGALPLHWAMRCKKPNLQSIDILVKAYPESISRGDAYGYSPLHWAVNNDDPDKEIIEYIIQKNPESVSKPAVDGSLPLHWCVDREKPNIEITKQLISCNPKAVKTQCQSGWLPLHRCVNRSNPNMEIVKLLVEEYPLGLQCPNITSQLPIHLAADHPHPSYRCIEYLASKAPKALEYADEDGLLPLHLLLDAEEESASDHISLLLEMFPESAGRRTNSGHLPLHILVRNKHPNMALIARLAQLYPAAITDNVVDSLSADEFDAQLRSKREWNPLSWAADTGNRLLEQALRSAASSSSAVAGPIAIDIGKGAQQRANETFRVPRPLPPKAMPPSLRAASKAASALASLGTNRSIEDSLIPGGQLDTLSIDSMGASIDALSVSSKLSKASKLRASKLLGPSTMTPIRLATKDFLLKKEKGKDKDFELPRIASPHHNGGPDTFEPQHQQGGGGSPSDILYGSDDGSSLTQSYRTEEERLIDEKIRARRAKARTRLRGKLEDGSYSATANIVDNSDLSRAAMIEKASNNASDSDDVNMNPIRKAKALNSSNPLQDDSRNILRVKLAEPTAGLQNITLPVLVNPKSKDDDNHSVNSSKYRERDKAPQPLKNTFLGTVNSASDARQKDYRESGRQYSNAFEVEDIESDGLMQVQSQGQGEGQGRTRSAKYSAQASKAAAESGGRNFSINLFSGKESKNDNVNVRNKSGEFADFSTGDDLV
jgi:ankyrin repeat protein